MSKHVSIFESLYGIRKSEIIGGAAAAVLVLGGFAVVNQNARYTLSSGESKATRNLAQDYGTKALEAYAHAKTAIDPNTDMYLKHVWGNKENLMVVYNADDLATGKYTHYLLSVDYDGSIESIKDDKKQIDPNAITSVSWAEEQCVITAADATCSTKDNAIFADSGILRENWTMGVQAGWNRKINPNRVDELLAHIQQ